MGLFTSFAPWGRHSCAQQYWHRFGISNVPYAQKKGEKRNNMPSHFPDLSPGSCSSLTPHPYPRSSGSKQHRKLQWSRMQRSTIFHDFLQPYLNQGLFRLGKKEAINIVLAKLRRVRSTSNNTKLWKWDMKCKENSSGHQKTNSLPFIWGALLSKAQPFGCCFFICEKSPLHKWICMNLFTSKSFQIHLQFH